MICAVKTWVHLENSELTPLTFNLWHYGTYQERQTCFIPALCSDNSRIQRFVVSRPTYVKLAVLVLVQRCCICFIFPCLATRMIARRATFQSCTCTPPPRTMCVYCLVEKTALLITLLDTPLACCKLRLKTTGSRFARLQCREGSRFECDSKLLYYSSQGAIADTKCFAIAISNGKRFIECFTAAAVLLVCEALHQYQSFRRYLHSPIRRHDVPVLSSIVMILTLSIHCLCMHTAKLTSMIRHRLWLAAYKKTGDHNSTCSAVTRRPRSPILYQYTNI